MATMTNNNPIINNQLSEEEIDYLVEQQAEDDNAWEEPTLVTPKITSLSIPQELAAKVAFFASLHQEKNLENWLIRIVKERIQLEEIALNNIKQELAKKYY
jgi:hypothetical protein